MEQESPPHADQFDRAMGQRYGSDIFELHQTHIHIPCPDDYNSHKGIPALPFSRSQQKLEKPKSKKYPKTLITIADHLIKRRLDLHLYQSDVAKRIGVSEDCVRFWENGQAIPQIQYYPQIVKFLGYNFFQQKEGDSLSIQIQNYRIVHGLSHKKMGKELEVDASTVSSWEKGKYKPNEKIQKKLITFLSM